MPTLEPPPAAFAYRLRTRMIQAAIEELDEAAKESPKSLLSGIEAVILALEEQIQCLEHEWGLLWEHLGHHLVPATDVRPVAEAAERLLLAARDLLERLTDTGAPFELRFASMAKKLDAIESKISSVLDATNVPIAFDPERVKTALEQLQRGEGSDVSALIAQRKAEEKV